MASIFRHTTEIDERKLMEFLTSVLDKGGKPDALNFSLLRWKYWHPRGDFKEPRSYIIERDGRVIAHVGLWPVTVRTGERSDRGVHMIDWASDPGSPGAGVSLLQRLTRKYNFVYSIGGSEMTQVILPKFGFHIDDYALTWACPIRPWRQMLRHQSRDLRLPFRLVRNMLWSKTPRNNLERGGSAVKTAMPGSEGLESFTKERDEYFFRYIQQCPVAQYLAFDIVTNDRKTGLLVLSIVQNQSRIAGVWLEVPSPENWRVAFQLALKACKEYTDTSELIARCATPASHTGAEQAGMRLRARTPVLIFRKDKNSEIPLQFQLCDNDELFLGWRLTHFLT
jgi:hypothetical protein